MPAQSTIGLVNSVEAHLGFPRQTFPCGLFGTRESNERGNRGGWQAEGSGEKSAHDATLIFVTIVPISLKCSGNMRVVVVAVAVILTKVDESSFSTHDH